MLMQRKSLWEGQMLSYYFKLPANSPMQVRTGFGSLADALAAAEADARAGGNSYRFSYIRDDSVELIVMDELRFRAWLDRRRPGQEAA